MSKSQCGAEIADPAKCYFLKKDPNASSLDNGWFHFSCNWREGRGVSQAASAIATIHQLEDLVQSELMAKVGDIKTGLEKGVIGEISPTADFGEIIGTFKIISIMNGFVTCRIESVTKKIPNNAFIRVQIGQKEKEE